METKAVQGLKHGVFHLQKALRGMRMCPAECKKKACRNDRP